MNERYENSFETAARWGRNSAIRAVAAGAVISLIGNIVGLIIRKRAPFRRNRHHGTAPVKAACLMRHIEGHRRFLSMDGWDAPLGRAAADSPQPRLVVRGPLGHDNRPWDKKWQEFDGGEIVAYIRQRPVTPLPAAELRGPFTAAALNETRLPHDGATIPERM
jgi:hypothetical protein